MMKILTVVGARPQFIKAAMVSRVINNREDIVEEIIHTGQHYDHEMSRVFFDEMNIPQPCVNLSVGSGKHGKTTARMLEGIEAEILKRRPDALLVYGDTNSTLAAALAAAKMLLPTVHVEAGLRSFNKSMPEEINRILTDHCSSLLLCPTRRAVENLSKEGIRDGVHHVGDVMFDATLAFAKFAEGESDILERLRLRGGRYALATIHRQENTDDPRNLRSILEGLGDISGNGLCDKVVLPLHPRTAARVEAYGIENLLKPLLCLKPVSFIDMAALEKNARVIITDSGGIQKEAYFHRVPCVTLRWETEWVETIEHGWNQLAGPDRAKMALAVETAGAGSYISDYGEGKAAELVVGHLLRM